MAEIPEYVLDASVAVKWHLRDEEHAGPALRILKDYQEGKVGLLAPDHIRYEVASAVRVAVLRNRLTRDEGRSSLVDFYGWRIPTVRGDSLIFFAYDQAFRLRCSLYDALYYIWRSLKALMCLWFTPTTSLGIASAIAFP